jgi:hypothetical protein
VLVGVVVVGGVTVGVVVGLGLVGLLGVVVLDSSEAICCRRALFCAPHPAPPPPPPPIVVVGTGLVVVVVGDVLLELLDLLDHQR